MKNILVIPDCQVRADVPLEHLGWIGRFIVDKKPDVIVHIGDFCDFSGLSSYSKGKLEGEGVRLIDDINWAKKAQEILFRPMNEYNKARKKSKHKTYKPKKYITLGNHENRLARFINDNPSFDGFFDRDICGFRKNGFEVVPFLEVLTINGVHFSHYFQTTSMGNPASSARNLLNRRMSSCVQGHKQGVDWAHQYTPDGKKISAIIAGSCYLHDEPYLMQQNQCHWRGIIYLEDVHDGQFDENFITLDRLKRDYGEG